MSAARNLRFVKYLGLLAVFALLAWLRGVPLESRDEQGRTPLQRAALERDHDEMRRLLAAGADPDSTTSPRFRHWRDLVNLQGGRWDHSPPLELSARACDPAGLEILIDGGAQNARESIEGAVEASCEPALALLLAGPALSLPNMLVIRSVLGTQKTAVFVALVIVMATISGILYGAFFV